MSATLIQTMLIKIIAKFIFTPASLWMEFKTFQIWKVLGINYLCFKTATTMSTASHTRFHIYTNYIFTFFGYILSYSIKQFSGVEGRREYLNKPQNVIGRNREVEG